MAKFFTQEWCDLYKEAINNSAAYEEAAKTWEGDFYFITEPGGPIKEKGYMYVDLWHGKCRGCEVVTDPTNTNLHSPCSALCHLEANFHQEARFYKGTDHQTIQVDWRYGQSNALYQSRQ